MPHTLALDPSELAELHTQWGDAPHLHHALDVDHPFLTGNHQLITSDQRRAEICYVMHEGDPAQGVLLHRKVYYPPQGYRLPTGGIHHGESVLDTLAREIYEETGFVVGENGGEDAARKVVVQRYLGVVTYAFRHRTLGATHEFATYYFLVQKPLALPLDPQDETELIADWRWLPAAQLREVAETLRHIGDNDVRWSHWGCWRALSHDFVAEMLG